MLLHERTIILTDDGHFQRIILRGREYYTKAQRIEMDKQVALLSGPVRTYYASSGEIERFISK